MKIIADSGSTKCTWLLTDGVHTREVRTRGINAVQHSPEQIREALAELPPCGAAEAVYFYGAGCGRTFHDATAKMVRALSERFGAEHVEAESDLLGAARALFGRGEGVACILGTGSNSCWCRGGEIVENVPPLGYVLGDEGSGATLGRNLVTDIRDMVARSFADFAGRNLSRYPAHLPVACVGGVAAAFGDLLRETLTRCGREVVTIVRSPAAGLTEYHYGKQNNRTGFGL